MPAPKHARSAIAAPLAELKSRLPQREIAEKIKVMDLAK